MILFHGTSKSKGEKILKDGYFSITAEGNYQNKFCAVEGKIHSIETEPGYIYLTNYFSRAYVYARSGIVNNYSDDKDIYIFKLDIDERELLPDYDELKIVYPKREEKLRNYNALELLNKIFTTRVAKNLYLKNTKAEVLSIPCDYTNFENSEFFDTNIFKKIKNMGRLKCDQEKDLEELKKVELEIQFMCGWKKI